MYKYVANGHWALNHIVTHIISPYVGNIKLSWIIQSNCLRDNVVKNGGFQDF